jgi:dUTP pyrophosphatase
MSQIPDTLEVQVVRLPSAAGLSLPQYQTAGAAGMDLVAAVDADLIIEPGSIGRVPTGLTIAIPPGWEAQIRPRSGLAVTHGITLPNAPATIDADYRGEIQVPLINLGKRGFTVQRGMRIAQMIFARVGAAVWREVIELPASDRGGAGFGHTGV